MTCKPYHHVMQNSASRPYAKSQNAAYMMHNGMSLQTVGYTWADLLISNLWYSHHSWCGNMLLTTIAFMPGGVTCLPKTPSERDVEMQLLLCVGITKKHPCLQESVHGMYGRMIAIETSRPATNSNCKGGSDFHNLKVTSGLLLHCCPQLGWARDLVTMPTQQHRHISPSLEDQSCTQNCCLTDNDA